MENNQTVVTKTEEVTVPAAEEAAQTAVSEVVSAEAAAIQESAPEITPAAEVQAAEVQETAPVQDTAPAVQEVAPVKETVPAPRKKRTGLIIGLSAAALAVILAAGGIFGLYFSGKNLYDQGSYAEARSRFQTLGFIPSFGEMADECDYAQAGQYVSEGKYLLASKLYNDISDYKDAGQLCDSSFYLHALSLLEAQRYDEAREAFLVIKDYEDAQEKADEALFGKAGQLFEEGEYKEARDIYVSLGNYDGAADGVIDCDLAVAVGLYEEGKYEKAFDLFSEHYEEREEARMYTVLCTFQEANLEGVPLESIYMIYEALEEYAGNEIVDEALEHPFFFIARFFGACWETEDHIYSLDADYREMMIYEYLPWTSGNGDVYFISDDEGCIFYVEEDHWFTITGFGSYDELHPDVMYICDPDQNQYTMYKYDEYPAE